MRINLARYPLALAFAAYAVGASIQRSLPLPDAAILAAAAAAGLVLLGALVNSRLLLGAGAEQAAVDVDELDAWAEEQDNPATAARGREADQRQRAARARWRYAVAAGFALGAFGLGAWRQAVLDGERALVEAVLAAPLDGAKSAAIIWQLDGRLAEQPRFYESGGAGLVLSDVKARPLTTSSMDDLGALALTSVHLPGFARIGLSGRVVEELVLNEQHAMPGEEMRFIGELQATAALGIEGVRLPAAALAGRRIYARGYAHYAGAIQRAANAGKESSDRGMAASLRAWAWNVHRRAAAAIESAVADPDRRGTVQTLLLGHSPWTDDALRTRYRRTGLIHLFAVSGLHTGLLAALIFALGRLGGLSLRGSAWLVVACLPIYLTVIGFRPSAARAAVMTVALLMPHLAGIGTSRLTALALAAWAIVLPHPEALWQMGFQLSFAAVAGLLFLPRPIMAAFSPDERRLAVWRRRLPYRLAARFVFQPLAYCVAVAVTMLPLQILYDLPVPLLGVLANIPAIPLATLTLGFGFIGATLGLLLPALAAPALALASVSAGLQNAWVETVAGSEWASTAAAPIPAGFIIAYYAVLFVAPYVVVSRAVVPWYGAMARSQLIVRCVALALLVQVDQSTASRRRQTGFGAPLRAAFLDVQQGDATVLHLPMGGTVLIDGGTRYPVDRGRSVVLPYLRAQGIRRLDAVIATHNDADHIGGLISVLEEMPVDVLIDLAADPRDSNAYAEWSSLRKRARRYFPGERGLTISEISGATIYILSPDTEEAGTGEWIPPNERSLVLLVDYGDSELLLMGDAGEPTEAALADLGLLLDIDFLKAGHHGSNTAGSRPFLDRISAELAVISCGASNAYGHPHPDALNRYEASVDEVLLTPREGSVLRDFSP